MKVCLLISIVGFCFLISVAKNENNDTGGIKVDARDYLGKTVDSFLVAVGVTYDEYYFWYPVRESGRDVQVGCSFVYPNDIAVHIGIKEMDLTERDIKQFGTKTVECIIINYHCVRPYYYTTLEEITVPGTRLYM